MSHVWTGDTVKSCGALVISAGWRLPLGLVHLWTDQRTPDPVSCRCPEPRVGLLETPPCWHATHDLLQWSWSELKKKCSELWQSPIGKNRMEEVQKKSDRENPDHATQMINGLPLMTSPMQLNAFSLYRSGQSWTGTIYVHFMHTLWINNQ